MTTTGLINILTHIVLFGGAVSQIPVHRIQSAELQQMPHRLDDAYLIGLTVERRREICVQVCSEMDDFVFQPDYYFYIPEAHVYTFDGEEWLALQCPTYPPIYVSHDWMEKGTRPDNHEWYVRMVEPRDIHDYKFRFEVVYLIGNIKLEPEDIARRSKGHIFYNMSQRMRWHICNEARKRIRYEINIKEEYLNEGPRFYEFTYSVIRKMNTYTIRCFRSPGIYLHTEHEFPEEDKLIMISLVNYNSSKDEMNPKKNIA